MSSLRGNSPHSGSVSRSDSGTVSLLLMATPAVTSSMCFADASSVTDGRSRPPHMALLTLPTCPVSVVILATWLGTDVETSALGDKTARARFLVSGLSQVTGALRARMSSVRSVVLRYLSSPFVEKSDPATTGSPGPGVTGLFRRDPTGFVPGPACPRSAAAEWRAVSPVVVEFHNRSLV